MFGHDVGSGVGAGVGVGLGAGGEEGVPDACFLQAPNWLASFPHLLSPRWTAWSQLWPFGVKNGVKQLRVLMPKPWQVLPKPFISAWHAAMQSWPFRRAEHSVP